MSLLINFPESLNVQNSKESNPNVGGINPPKNVDLDLNLSSWADDESDNTVQVPVTATPSFSDCAVSNRKNSHDIYVTDHAMNVNIFKLYKKSQVCLTTFHSPQIMKNLKQTTDLENKRLKHVTRIRYRK